MMQVTPLKVTVRELIEGYHEKDNEEGVIGYGGRLDIRPPYQREYVYKEKDQDEVIRTVLKNFPLGAMYWFKHNAGHYEVMDGQQRTIAICRYAAENYQTFSVDFRNFFHLKADEKERFLDYELMVYECTGEPSEIEDWFKIINIVGKPLTAQELRNIAYVSPWLSDAKRFFSKTGCAAHTLAADYVSGSAIRQAYLETALKWAADRESLESGKKCTIEDYMAAHSKDDADATQLKLYFKEVINWAREYFDLGNANIRPGEHAKRAKIMQTVPWGYLYNRYKDHDYTGKALNAKAMEKKIHEAITNSEVTKKAGVYEYVLSGDEKFLSLREFDTDIKLEKYEEQKGICPKCKKHFEFNEMEADHIVPWSKGGKSTRENCQMLCRSCNIHKSDK